MAKSALFNTFNSKLNRKLLKATAIVVIGAFLFNTALIDLVWAYTGGKADFCLRVTPIKEENVKIRKLERLIQPGTIGIAIYISPGDMDKGAGDSPTRTRLQRGTIKEILGGINEKLTEQGYNFTPKDLEQLLRLNQLLIYGFDKKGNKSDFGKLAEVLNTLIDPKVDKIEVILDLASGGFERRNPALPDENSFYEGIEIEQVEHIKKIIEGYRRQGKKVSFESGAKFPNSGNFNFVNRRIHMPSLLAGEEIGVSKIRSSGNLVVVILRRQIDGTSKMLVITRGIDGRYQVNDKVFGGKRITDIDDKEVREFVTTSQSTELNLFGVHSFNYVSYRIVPEWMLDDVKGKINLETREIIRSKTDTEVLAFSVLDEEGKRITNVEIQSREEGKKVVVIDGIDYQGDLKKEIKLFKESKALENYLKKITGRDELKAPFIRRSDEQRVVQEAKRKLLRFVHEGDLTNRNFQFLPIRAKVDAKGRMNIVGRVTLGNKTKNVKMVLGSEFAGSSIELVVEKFDEDFGWLFAACEFDKDKAERKSDKALGLFRLNLEKAGIFEPINELLEQALKDFLSGRLNIFGREIKPRRISKGIDEEIVRRSYISLGSITTAGKERYIRFNVKNLLNEGLLSLGDTVQIVPEEIDNDYKQIFRIYKVNEETGRREENALSAYRVFKTESQCIQQFDPQAQSWIDYISENTNMRGEKIMPRVIRVKVFRNIDNKGKLTARIYIGLAMDRPIAGRDQRLLPFDEVDIMPDEFDEDYGPLFKVFGVDKETGKRLSESIGECRINREKYGYLDFIDPARQALKDHISGEVNINGQLIEPRPIWANVGNYRFIYLGLITGEKNRIFGFSRRALAPDIPRKKLPLGTPLLILPERVIPGFIWIFKVYLVEEILERKIPGKYLGTYRINNAVERYFEPIDIKDKFWPIYQVGQEVKDVKASEFGVLGKKDIKAPKSAVLGEEEGQILPLLKKGLSAEEISSLLSQPRLRVNSLIKSIFLKLNIGLVERVSEDKSVVTVRFPAEEEEKEVRRVYSLEAGNLGDISPFRLEFDPATWMSKWKIPEGVIKPEAKKEDDSRVVDLKKAVTTRVKDRVGQKGEPRRLTIAECRQELLENLGAIRELYPVLQKELADGLEILNKEGIEAFEERAYPRIKEAAGKIRPKVERIQRLPALFGFSEPEVREKLDSFLGQIAEGTKADKVLIHFVSPRGEYDFSYTQGFSEQELTKFRLNHNEIIDYITDLRPMAQGEEYEEGIALLKESGLASALEVVPVIEKWQKYEDNFIKIVIGRSEEYAEIYGELREEDRNLLRNRLNALIDKQTAPWLGIRYFLKEHQYADFDHLMLLLRHNGSVNVFTQGIFPVINQYIPRYIEKVKLNDNESQKYLDRLVENLKYSAGESQTSRENETFLDILKSGTDFKPRKITQYLQDRVESFREKAELKGLDFITELSDESFVVDFCDLNLLGVLIDNLIENAIKYTKKGKVKIYLTKKMFKGQYDDQARECAVLEVEDSGIGIPQSDQPKIFGRGYRASNVADIQGTGVGLNVAHTITGLMRGDIYVQSEVEKGTKFTVALPLYQPEYTVFKSSIKGLERELKIAEEYAALERIVETAAGREEFSTPKTPILCAEPLLEKAGVVDLNKVLTILLRNNLLGKVIISAREKVNADILEKLIREVEPELEIIRDIRDKSQPELSEVKEIEKIIELAETNGVKAKDIFYIFKGTVTDHEALASLAQEKQVKIVVFDAQEGPFSMIKTVQEVLTADFGIIILPSLKIGPAREEKYEEYRNSLQVLRDL